MEGPAPLMDRKTWLVEDGMLINRLEHTQDKVTHGHGIDLLTDEKFRISS